MSTYRTARGAMLNMDHLRLANEATVAVGNTRTNARGDQLDENGNVVVTKNQAMNQHYNTARSRQNVPRDEPVSRSTSEAKERERAKADDIDSAKLQEQIEMLTKQLAEKDALLNQAQPAEEPEVPPQVVLTDEIDDLIPPATPLRGGLAKAIAKKQETEEIRNKRI